MLPDKSIAIYCFCDDLLKALHHKTKEGCCTTDREIITTALVAALFFKGNQSLGLHYMCAHHMAPELPCKSGFTKRLHALSDLLLALFEQVGHLVKGLNCTQRYILDSFPAAACHNIRISRCRLQRGGAFHGFCAAKKQYSYGIKIQLLFTEEGVPVEACFVPGREHDSQAIAKLLWDFEPGASI